MKQPSYTATDKLPETILVYDFDFSRTMRHPLAKRGLIEMVSTKWLAAISCPSVSWSTDLGDRSGRRVVASTLWEHMQENGMRDPFVIAVNLQERTCRLELGNHRIRLFAEQGVTEVPAVALVSDSGAFCPENGAHVHHRELIIKQVAECLPPDPEGRYAAPSHVFKELATLANADAATVSETGMAREARC